MKPIFVSCRDENNQAIENKWYALVSPCYILERSKDEITGQITYRISSESEKISWRNLTEAEMNEYEFTDGVFDEIRNCLFG